MGRYGTHQVLNPSKAQQISRLNISANERIELIVEIGSYLLQLSPPQLSAEPFTEWKDIIHAHGSASQRQARNYYALAASCKKLRNMLSSQPSHAYASINTTRLTSALQVCKVSSLSICDLRELEEEMGLFDSGCTSGILTTKAVKVCGLLPDGYRINTLYMLSGWAQGHTLNMLFAKFKMLETLYFSYEGLKYPSPTSDDRRAELHFPLLVSLLQCHFWRLQKLVITRGRVYEYDDGSTDLGLGPEASLRGFHELRSLSIGSYLLLGDGEKFDCRKRIYRFLPSSLVELEVMYDGQFNNTFITGTSAARPQWLFHLLDRKERYNNQLQRVRVISLLEWDPTTEEDDIWSRRYRRSSGDWVPEDGNETWKPPMELIIAFQKANVSFGLWLHKLRNYKMVGPDGTWFGDSWEETWTGEKYDSEEEDEKEKENDYRSEVAYEDDWREAMIEGDRPDSEHELLAEFLKDHHNDDTEVTGGHEY